MPVRACVLGRLHVGSGSSEASKALALVWRSACVCEYREVSIYTLTSISCVSALVVRLVGRFVVVVVVF